MDFEFCSLHVCAFTGNRDSLLYRKVHSRAGKRKHRGFPHPPKGFLRDIPYELNDRTERHYQVVFYIVFKLLGQFTEAEVRSAQGRADAIVKTPRYIYVFEFKLRGTAEEAIRQIDDRGYLIPYTADEREVVKVGVAFDAATRNLGEWLIEKTL